VETPLIETGTGSHTALRQMIASQLDLRPQDVEVTGVGTGALPRDAGAGGSRVTAGLAAAVDAAAKAWAGRLRDEPVAVELNEGTGPRVGSYVAQIAQVAVDPETGQLLVLEILTAADVASVVNPAAFQMQIDGGVAMGYGFACLEDLGEADGQVWSATLGEFKLPTARDVPRYRTVHVPGAIGVGTANVKNIGESTTPPVAPAIAGAVFAATGCRLRDLPLTAEKIFDAMRGLPS
jgi:putative selenate reductase molybdopterin-binding subunit